jgi:hypothetical protein
MIKRILLGLGGTPYTTVAIQRAVEIAKRFDFDHLATCDDYDEPRQAWNIT